MIFTTKENYEDAIDCDYSTEAGEGTEKQQLEEWLNGWIKMPTWKSIDIEYDDLDTDTTTIYRRDIDKFRKDALEIQSKLGKLAEVLKELNQVVKLGEAISKTT